eukprot:scaffold2531_cov126-Skeletonema_dohrnii-CCMP3373.AAC.1
MGGDQVVPDDVRRVRIDKSVKIIPSRAFYGRIQLIYVEFHDGIEIVEEDAFGFCTSLRSVKLLGVKIIGYGAFYNCVELIDVEFDKLETIEQWTFNNCRTLRSLTMPSVKTIDRGAFANCVQITDLELPEGLETLQEYAFSKCERLSRIAIPLNCMIGRDDVFYNCPRLATVDLVGKIHKTVASLHLKSWRNEMEDEINRINQDLPTIGGGKTAAVQQWMELVTRRLDHYRAEHKALLKEATTLLELALWKANLDDNEGGIIEKEGVRITRGRRKRARKEICVTSGANIVIKNVLPFLQLK